jgi:hypothetical protein
MTDPAAGWYADPGGRDGLRWWDGQRWTDHTRSSVAPPVVPPPAPASVTAPAWPIGPGSVPASPMSDAPTAPAWPTPGDPGSDAPTAPAWPIGPGSAPGAPPTPPPAWPPVFPGTTTAPAPAPAPTSHRRGNPLDRRLVIGLISIGLAVVLLTAVAVAMIGSHSSTPTVNADPATGQTSTPATAPPTTGAARPAADSAAARQYLAAAAALDQAQMTFLNGLNQLPEPVSIAQLASLAAPFGQALDTFDQALLGVSLPPSMESDRDGLVADNGSLRDDVLGVSGFSTDELDEWSNALLDGLRQSGQAAAALRSDLGLPPAPRYPGQGTTI